MNFWMLRAVGIGEPGEPIHLRPGQKHLRSLHLSPWSTKFQFGYIVGWSGIFWHRSIGVIGPDWNDKTHPYYGPPSGFRKRGPFATVRWRRRGSLRSDIQFERNMGCHCQHIIVKWFQGHGHVKHMILCMRLNEPEDT